MEASAATTDAVERANELYWESNRSVNQIAEDLDLSKGALYAMIEPLAADRGCPLCGAEVVFSNRTAKERGRLDCPDCDWDGTLDETIPYEPASAEEIMAVAEREGVVEVDEDRLRTIAGGALLGAAVGLALVLWARRR